MTDSLSPTRIALGRFRKHRLAVYGGIVLGGLYGSMLLSGFLAPYSFETGARLKPFHPPSRIHFRTESGAWTRPFIYNTVPVVDEANKRHYVEVTEADLPYLRRALGSEAEDLRAERYPIRLFVRGDPYSLFGFIPAEVHFFGIEAVERSRHRPMLYLFGADDLGRDLLSRILYGAQVSLTIGLFAVAITFSLGLVLGGISGYFGGKIDFLLQRIVEGMMMLPGFYILLALYAALPTEMHPIRLYFAVVLILSFIGWAGLARTIRGIVLSLRENEYVLAARALGARPLVIIVRHILPQTFSYAIVSVTLAIPGYMLGESALSFLGLGIREPYASWGNMLMLSREPTNVTHYPWVLIPGFFICLTVIAFNFVGDGLRDAFDPKSTTHRSD